MAQLVHDFETGGMAQKDLLGGKGANLAEMTRLGIPVPPGFTITTDACRAYFESGSAPPELFAEVDEHLERLEARLGRILGDGKDPLLVSVRSGAKCPPSCMDTAIRWTRSARSRRGFCRRTRWSRSSAAATPPCSTSDGRRGISRKRHRACTPRAIPPTARPP